MILHGALLDVDVLTAGAPQPLPPCPYAFPDMRRAPRAGPAAAGADFEPATVVAAYRAGAFPWPHGKTERLWFSPDPRAVIEPEGLHVSRRLARTLRAGRFRATVDAAFEAVVRGCAARSEGTWITPAIVEAYTQLHQLGWAHSVEVWTPDGHLAGGLYGLRVGALFGAESMFHHASDASKAAMVAMMDWARATGVRLLDVQILSPHTARMGAVEITRDAYLARLRDAVGKER
ncbi:MAG: leucyl/phenylalanyl-tRNA--protein transferase [Dehalococcoidia bacterium]|nr:leucyl/phenylalanyl-tRNA--protein transferase [Dehalococcoidia bacterium]